MWEVAREIEFGNYRCRVYEGRYPERAARGRCCFLAATLRSTRRG